MAEVVETPGSLDEDEQKVYVEWNKAHPNLRRSTMAMFKISWDCWVEADDIVAIWWNSYSRCPEVRTRGDAQTYRSLDFQTENLSPTREEIGTAIQELVDEVHKFKSVTGAEPSVYTINNKT
jgi:hypothetical protein